MRLFVLTPIYATTTSNDGATPLVHYFAKEWAALGHEVYVIHLVAQYPKFFYFVAKQFQHQLNNLLGQVVPTEITKQYEAEYDGVKVFGFPIKKIRPHGRYRKSQLMKAANYITHLCERLGEPDMFIGPWDNPQLDILNILKSRFHKPVALVLHNNDFHLENTYGKDTKELLANIDYLGFRSLGAKKKYEKLFGPVTNSFMAYSGVSSEFIEAGSKLKTFNQHIDSFIFIGSLIDRKHPRVIVESLRSVYVDEPFKMVYVGNGAEQKVIESENPELIKNGQVVFAGRIPRGDVITWLKNAQVFVMISEREVFGLVYLESMALGLIPIGARGEGIDGIIIDGENGFLCNAGDGEELSLIIRKIKNKSQEELQIISENARKTALSFSDREVAKSYLNSICK